MRRWVLTLSRRRGSEAAISDTAYPAPSDLHSVRNGRSVTPAIGATNTLLGSVYGPICMGGGAPETKTGATVKSSRRQGERILAKFRLLKKCASQHRATACSERDEACRQPVHNR